MNLILLDPVLFCLFVFFSFVALEVVISVRRSQRLQRSKLRRRNNKKSSVNCSDGNANVGV